eukprot:TRINITY_DN1581_c0_g1_i1.p1 TRINITY_DN1581_c0_g1~~TRINITY_DN1581_c0_g1_i1.p1  ORF type:complete len:573 (+),score=53.12 TRINITY_DN1581_c0_g1_i1:88-1806(+)
MPTLNYFLMLLLIFNCSFAQQIEGSFFKLFYDSTGGSGWTKNMWNYSAIVVMTDSTTPSTSCNTSFLPSGVKCNSLNITQMDLSTSNLSGTLPDGWDSPALTLLTFLDVSSNQLLSGTIPSSLSTLSFLRTLKLNRCNFTGDIRNLSNLTSLNTLEIIGNKYLNISIDYLLGLNLNSLSITNSNIEYLSNISNLVNLTTLNLDYNNISTPNLDYLNFSKINTLRLNSNRYNLSLSIFEGLSNLRMSIRNLYIDRNLFVGNISVFSTFSKLVLIDADSNKIVGDIMTFATIDTIENIDLSFNPSITGDLSSLQNKTSLTNLNLKATSVVGDLSSLSNLTNLKTLHLPVNVSGDIAALSKLTNLETIEIGGVDLSECLPIIFSSSNCSTFSTCCNGCPTTVTCSISPVSTATPTLPRIEPPTYQNTINNSTIYTNNEDVVFTNPVSIVNSTVIFNNSIVTFNGSVDVKNSSTLLINSSTVKINGNLNIESSSSLIVNINNTLSQVPITVDTLVLQGNINFVLSNQSSSTIDLIKFSGSTSMSDIDLSKISVIHNGVNIVNQTQNDSCQSSQPNH